MNVRGRLVMAAMVLVGVGLSAVPAGATSTQSKYTTTLHRVAPATKNFSNAKMVALAKGGLCPIVGLAGVSVAIESLEQSKDNTGATDGYGFPKSQAPKILTVAVDYYCAKYKKKLIALKKGATQGTGTPATVAAPSTTTAPTAPPLTQQQQTAVASAKQYLELEGFSQAGLIAQLDSPDGGQFSVNDATIAVNSLNENWNAEAMQSAKSYMQLEPMSCQALIDQLDSPDGAQFTVAQATYGAQQAGDCG
jgi:hypothetical protein